MTNPCNHTRQKRQATNGQKVAVLSLGVLAGLGLGNLAGCMTERAYAAPCAKHTESTKVTKAACMKEVKRKAARAKLAWPPEPSVREVRVRVDKIGGKGTYAKAWRIARCETGARPRWYLGPKGEIRGRYVSMMGMYSKTWAYGARRTGYDGSSPQEQIAVAVASFPITRGWSGWGCSAA